MSSSDRDESDTSTSVLHILVVLVVFTILMFCCVGCVSRAKKSVEERGEDGDFWRLYGKEIGRAVAFGREDVNDAVRQVIDQWFALQNSHFGPWCLVCLPSDQPTLFDELYTL